MKSRLLPLLVVLLPLSACSLKGLVDEINDEAAKIGTLSCSCDNPVLTTEACLELFGNAVVETDKCTLDALKEDKSKSKEVLNCFLDETKDARKCLEANLDCEDPNSTNECTPNYESCDQFPQKVQDALEACNQG